MKKTKIQLTLVLEFETSSLGKAVNEAESIAEELESHLLSFPDIPVSVYDYWAKEYEEII